MEVGIWEFRYSASMSDCLFCRVISGEIKGSIVHQDNDLVAISDINPDELQEFAEKFQATLHAGGA